MSEIVDAPCCTKDFKDPGEVPYEKIMEAYKKYDEIDTGMKILEPMFITVYRNGWEFVRQNPDTVKGPNPPEHTLREMALSMPMPRLPIDTEDIVGAFKMGYEDCIKAGTAH